MNEAISLGKVAGVPLRVHWSVLVILWLFAWSLASTLPLTAPGWSTPAYWLAGLAGAVLLLASLLAYEMMHAVVARRAGVRVSGITLWLFGGVARLGDDAPTARADLRIATSGPAVSLGLAALVAALAELFELLHVAPLVVGLAWWLSRINLVLGLFNLLPGAPLDGDRILRALLWLRHGDRLFVRTRSPAPTISRTLNYRRRQAERERRNAHLGRTTITGMPAACATAELTEPNVMLANAPRPRLPTITS